MADESVIIIPTENSYAGWLYRNAESFPGQVFSTPQIMPAAQETRRSRRDVVRAARHVERYSEHIRGGIDRKADMVVGPRIMVHARPDWDALGIEDWETKKPFAQALEREFRNWAYDTRLLQDAEGHYDFGGLMWLAFRNLTGPDGECAGVIHYDPRRAEAFGHHWATAVQILDPDRVETPPNLVDNPNVVDGKLLDPFGRMLGMYVRRYNPRDGYAYAVDHEFVPRELPGGRPAGFHWFVKTRAGQLRGISTLVTVLKQSGMLDKFDDVYLAAATINAAMATWIETPASTEVVAENIAPAARGIADGGWGLFEQKLGYYDKSKIRIGGARIPVMPPGDKIQMTAVNRAIDDPTAFRNGFLREFASALGISFEQLSQNFSDANYSAARAAMIDVWRGIVKLRVMFMGHVGTPIYAAVVEEAIVKGRVTLPAGAPPFGPETRAAYCGCAWTGPGMPQIDPLKEANAAKTLLEIKVASRQEIVAERGGDYLEVFDQIEQERMEADERGFSLDPLAPGTPMEGDAGGDGSEDGGTPPPPKKGSKSKQGAGAGRDGDGDGQTNEEDQ